MKVTFYNREKREGNYSIEELFQNIRKTLEKDIVISEYHLPDQNNKFKKIKEASKYEGDVNHITGDANYLSFGLDPRKTILTIHDLGHYEVTLTGIKRFIYKYIW